MLRLRVSPRTRKLAFAIASVGGILSLGLVAVGAWLLASGKSGSGGEDVSTTSRAFKDDASKVKFLEKHLKFMSRVEAAEFRLFVDAGGIGPSEWDIRAVLKIAPADVKLWTAGMTLRADLPSNVSWAKGILPPEARWKVTSAPEVYVRESCTLTAHAAEGILFKKCSTLEAQSQ